jgi:glycosyltransferase involved in cell wall biosynthesis
MFLARSPRAPMTGRKTVIHSTVHALGAEGHEVDLFVMAHRPAGAAAPGKAFVREAERRHAGRARRAVWLGTPAKHLVARNVGLCLAMGRQSLNEALFHSSSLLSYSRRLRPLYDYAIADTIRTARYADALGLPWHLDLDDLLSARYSEYAERRDGMSASLVLGYYRDSLPKLACALPKYLLERVLRTESRRLVARERYWAGKAGTVSLVSRVEAQRFERFTGRQVYSLPMSVSIPAARWRRRAAAANRGVFLGGLDYKPNLDALKYYETAVFPALRRAFGPGVPPLAHIGNAPEALRRQFSSSAVSFEGYVEDLPARLGDADFFVAPIVSGTGIKVKVLQAMAVGVPVIATASAVRGLEVEHKRDCYICHAPEDFTAGIRYLSNPVAAADMGDNARHYVDANFSAKALRRRWNEVLGELAARGTRSCSPH